MILLVDLLEAIISEVSQQLSAFHPSKKLQETMLNISWISLIPEVPSGFGGTWENHGVFVTKMRMSRANL